MKKAFAVLLIIAMFMGIVPESKGQATPFSVRLTEKSVALIIQKSGKQIVYGTSTIQIKKIRGVKIRKVSYRSQNKRIASVSAKGRVKAKEKGVTQVIVTVKYKWRGKLQTKKLRYKVKVVEKKSSPVTDDPEADEDDEALGEENEDDTTELKKPKATSTHVIVKPIQKITEPTASPVVSKGEVKPTTAPTPVKAELLPTAVPAVTPQGIKPASTPAVPKKETKPTAAPTPPKKVTKPTAAPTPPKKETKPTAAPTPPKKVTKPAVTPAPPQKSAKPSYITLPDGAYKISSKVKSGMMLDVSGGASKNCTNTQYYHDNESAAQRFNITHISSGWYKICSQSSGKALDVTGAEKKSGVNVQLYDYNGSAAQLWRFISTSQGYFYIQNKLGYYLDVEGGKTSNDTNVQVYSKNETDSQKWKPERIVYPQKINLNSSSFTLTNIGAVKKITVSFAPADTTQKNIAWATSDNKVVTVSNGTVKAVGSGTATITAKTSNGKTASVKVTVNDGCVNVKNGLYNINTKVSGSFTLDVKGNGTTDGTNVQIYKNNGSVAQKFQVESVGNGWYVISNTYPKMCLDVQGGSSKSGTNVNLYHYNGSDAQKWRFFSAGNGYYYIMNKCGNYLDLSGRVAKNDTNVQVYKKNGTDAQRWKLVKTEAQYVNIASGLYSLYSKVGNNFVLDISGAGTADGTNIQIYQGNDSIAQKFKIQVTPDGWFTILNPLSGKCLDVQGGIAKSGLNVQLHTSNGTDAQKWRFYTAGDSDYFYIKNKLGFYLDVDGARAKNGTNVLVFTRNGSTAQKWRLRETSAIIVSPFAFTLDGIGKTKNLSVSLEPNHTFAANRTIKWSSSNTKVATVSNGTVKAVGAGTATITAKAYNGKTCAVTVTVKGNGAKISLKVPSYKQTDSRWCGTYIGNKTIGKIGCLLTSISMKYSFHTGTNTYPNAMKSKLKFVNNDLYWSSISSLGYLYTKDYNTGITGSVMSVIYSKLKEGKPVIIGGKKSNGSTHWVTITGYKGTNANSFSSSDFIINDPNSSSRITLNQFLGVYPTLLKLIY